MARFCRCATFPTAWPAPDTFGVSRKQFVPLLLRLFAAGNRALAIFHFVGHIERLVPLPAQKFLGGLDVVLAQRFAVRRGVPSWRTAVADDVLTMMIDGLPVSFLALRMALGSSARRCRRPHGSPASRRP